jgi:predicted dehydrogenase
MFRIGLVGIGKMGVSHLAIVRAHPHIDCVAVCDSQALLLAGARSQLGLDAYKSVDEMIASARLDGVIVSTPTSSHVGIARQALESGLGVFVEKPLTLRAADSRMLADLAQTRGLANQVGYHNRFIGTFGELRRLVEAGAIGRVHHVEGTAFGPVVTKPQGAGRTWRAKKSEGGGCLHDYACHVIDLMNFVVGPPDEVVGARMTHVHSAQVEDAVYALFEYGNGATGALETNWSDDSYRKMSTTITVYGTQGKVFADRQECRLYLDPGWSFEKFDSGWTVRYITELQEPVDFYLRGEEYSAQLDAFADALAGRPRPHASTFATAAETDEVVEQIVAFDGGGVRAARPLATPGSDVPTTKELYEALKRYVRALGASAAERLAEQKRRFEERRS